MSELEDILAELNQEGVFSKDPPIPAPAIEIPKHKINLPPVIEEEDDPEFIPEHIEELSDNDIVESNDISFEEKTLELFNKLYVAIGRLSDKVDRLAGNMRNPMQEQILPNGQRVQAPQPPQQGDPYGRSPAELIGTQIYRGKDAWKNVVTLGREENTLPAGVANGADAAFAALEYLEPTNTVQPLDFGMNQPRRNPPPIPQPASRQTLPPLVGQSRPMSASVPNNSEAFDFLSDL